MTYLTIILFITTNLISMSVGQQVPGVFGAQMFAMARLPVIFQDADPLGQQTISVDGYSEVRRRSVPSTLEESVLDEIGMNDQLILMMEIPDVGYLEDITAPIETSPPIPWEVEASGLADDSKLTEINYDIVAAASDAQISVSNEEWSVGNVLAAEEFASNVPLPSEIVPVSHNLTNNLTLSGTKTEAHVSVPTREKVPASERKTGLTSARGDPALEKKKKPKSTKKGPPRSKKPTSSTSVSDSNADVTERNESIDKKSYEPIHEKMIEPVDGERIRPVDGERIRPVDGERIRPVDGEMIGPVNGEMIGPVNGEMIGPVNGEMIGPVNGEMIGPVNGEMIGPVNGEMIGPVNGEMTEHTNKERNEENGGRSIPFSERNEVRPEMKERVTAKSKPTLETNGSDAENIERDIIVDGLGTEKVRPATPENGGNNTISEERDYFQEMSDLVTSLLEPYPERDTTSLNGFSGHIDFPVGDSSYDSKSRFDSAEIDEDEFLTPLHEEEIVTRRNDDEAVTMTNHKENNDLNKATGFPKTNQSASNKDGAKRKHPIRYVFDGEFVRKLQENILIIVAMMLGFPVTGVTCYFVYLQIRRRYTGRLDVSPRGFNLQNKLLHSQPLSSMTRCSEENELLVCSSSTVNLPFIPAPNNV